MVIAALISFGLLLAAWIAAPDRARHAPMSEVQVPQADAPGAAEPLAA